MRDRKLQKMHPRLFARARLKRAAEVVLYVDQSGPDFIVMRF
jgi:hypothetical protein